MRRDAFGVAGMESTFVCGCDRRLAAEDVKAGLTRTIVDTARALADGGVDLEGLAQMDDRSAVERLTRLGGIGGGPPEYVILQGLGACTSSRDTTSMLGTARAPARYPEAPRL